MKLLRVVVGGAIFVVFMIAVGIFWMLVNIALPRDLSLGLLVIVIVAVHEWRRKMTQNR
jgi:hypothetical protein